MISNTKREKAKKGTYIVFRENKKMSKILISKCNQNKQENISHIMSKICTFSNTSNSIVLLGKKWKKHNGRRGRRKEMHTILNILDGLYGHRANKPIRCCNFSRLPWLLDCINLFIPHPHIFFHDSTNHFNWKPPILLLNKAKNHLSR